MNIAESYSLSTGAKLGKIQISPKFFPLPFDKYITFAPFSKPSKSFKFWDDTLDIIHPVLKKAGIETVQLGAKDEKPFKNCHHTQGATSILQAAFLIENSMLLLSTDTWAAHWAGAKDIPLVDLISNNYADCVRPYYGDRNKQIIIEPPCRAEGVKPSFSLDEGSNPQIDQIAPETIAQAVLSLLNLPYEFPYKTLFFGKFYHERILEMIPNQILDPASLNVDSIVVRMDYLFDEKCLFSQIQRSKVTVVTNKPIQVGPLNQLRQNIKQIVYYFDLDYDLQFCKDLQKTGIPYVLIFRGEEEAFTHHKLNFVDINYVFFQPKPTKETFLKHAKAPPSDALYFKTNKFLLSDGKIYPGKAYWKAGTNIPEFECPVLPIIDNDDFWLELEHFYVLGATKCTKLKFETQDKTTNSSGLLMGWPGV